jgi:uncharacterized protein (UPF0548 family)
VFLLRRPSDEFIRQTIDEASLGELTYSHAGLTQRGQSPDGFARKGCQAVVGHGQADFESAKAAINDLAMLNFGWFSVVGKPTSIEPQQQISTLVKVAGLFSLQVARIIYVDDTEDRYGFGYGTLAGYPLSGEERFTVSWNRETDEVTYEIDSFSRPVSVLMRLGLPVVALNRWRFYRGSINAMRQAISTAKSSAVNV